MAYRFRGRGQFSSGTTRSGKSFNYSGRRVLLKGDNFELNWAGPQVIQQVLDAVSNAIQALSVAGLEYMQQIVAVDTGKLRESCYAEIDISGGTVRLVIGAGEPYAIYVELGTFKMEAQPYIRPTFDYIIKILPEIFKSEVARRAHGNSLT